MRRQTLAILAVALLAFLSRAPARATGSLRTGGSFAAPLTATVKSNGGALAASISPNPLNPSAKVTFVTTKPGAVRIQVFDLSGRLVRRVRDESQLAAGLHDVAIDARGADDNRLTSGVYFLKIWTQYDGEETKSFTVLK